MSCDGLKPVVAIYSTFLQRAFDQLIHDVGIQNLPVSFVLDRAGIVGADGPTHQGQYDISYMRAIPTSIYCSGIFFCNKSSPVPVAIAAVMPITLLSCSQIFKSV